MVHVFASLKILVFGNLGCWWPPIPHYLINGHTLSYFSHHSLVNPTANPSHDLVSALLSHHAGHWSPLLIELTAPPRLCVWDSVPQALPKDRRGEWQETALRILSKIEVLTVVCLHLHRNDLGNSEVSVSEPAIPSQSALWMLVRPEGWF